MASFINKAPLPGLRPQARQGSSKFGRLTTLLDNYANPNMPYRMGTRVVGGLLASVEARTLGRSSIGRAISWKARGETFKRTIASEITFAIQGRLGILGEVMSASIIGQMNKFDDVPDFGEDIHKLKQRDRAGKPVAIRDIIDTLEKSAQHIDHKFDMLAHTVRSMAPDFKQMDKRFEKFSQLQKANILKVSDKLMDQVKGAIPDPRILDNLETDVRRISTQVSEHESKLADLQKEISFLGARQRNAELGRARPMDAFGMMGRGDLNRRTGLEAGGGGFFDSLLSGLGFGTGAIGGASAALLGRYLLKNAATALGPAFKLLLRSLPVIGGASVIAAIMANKQSSASIAKEFREAKNQREKEEALRKSGKDVDTVTRKNQEDVGKSVDEILRIARERGNPKNIGEALINKLKADFKKYPTTADRYTLIENFLQEFNALKLTDVQRQQLMSMLGPGISNYIQTYERRQRPKKSSGPSGSIGSKGPLQTVADDQWTPGKGGPVWRNTPPPVDEDEKPGKLKLSGRAGVKIYSFLSKLGLGGPLGLGIAGAAGAGVWAGMAAKEANRDMMRADLRNENKLYYRNPKTGEWKEIDYKMKNNMDFMYEHRDQIHTWDERKAIMKQEAEIEEYKRKLREWNNPWGYFKPGAPPKPPTGYMGPKGPKDRPIGRMGHTTKWGAAGRDIDPFDPNFLLASDAMSMGPYAEYGGRPGGRTGMFAHPGIAPGRRSSILPSQNPYPPLAPGQASPGGALRTRGTSVGTSIRSAIGDMMGGGKIDATHPLSKQRLGLGGGKLSKSEKLHFYATMLAEEGGKATDRDLAALMETPYNRAMTEGDSSLMENITGAYYQPLRKGEGRWYHYWKEKLQSDPSVFKRLDNIHNQVLRGSNYSKLATQNASAGVAASARKTQTVTHVTSVGETLSRKDRPEFAGIHGAGTVKRTQEWVSSTTKELQQWNASRSGRSQNRGQSAPMDEQSWTPGTKFKFGSKGWHSSLKVLDDRRVDPALKETIMGGAIEAFGDPNDPDTRYEVRINNAFRHGGGRSRHGMGKATDLQIFDRQTGKLVGGHSGRDSIFQNAYGNPHTYKVYQALARGSYKYLHGKYGAKTANRLSWGGNFFAKQGKIGAAAKYGLGYDQMHYSFDEPGERGTKGSITRGAGGAIRSQLLKQGITPAGPMGSVDEWQSPYKVKKEGIVKTPETSKQGAAIKGDMPPPGIGPASVAHEAAKIRPDTRPPPGIGPESVATEVPRGEAVSHGKTESDSASGDDMYDRGAKDLTHPNSYQPESAMPSPGDNGYGAYRNCYI